MEVSNSWDYLYTTTTCSSDIRWYRGIIGRFYRRHNDIYDFFISFFWYGHFFQISKTKIFILNFKFVFFIFTGVINEIFQFFSFHLVLRPFFQILKTKIFIQNSKMKFVSNCFISLWWYGHFFSDFKNKHFHIKFKNIIFAKFLGVINNFFSSRSCQIY
jgi:hypothetical protein